MERGTMSRSLTTKYALGALAGLSLVGTLAGCSTATDAATDDTTTGTDSSSESSTDTGTSTDSGDTTTEGATGDSAYADGTYDAEGEYTSPGGTESISVELTLESGVVTAVTVTPEATSGNAVRYQNEFADGIAAEVVGEDIDDLDVDRVAGSSLTSGGFNEAVETIKADAEA
ncbi:MAG: hypothetical protein ABWY54_08240 [Glaciihabitans sp.]